MRYRRIQNPILILFLLTDVHMSGAVLANEAASTSAPADCSQASKFGVRQWFEIYDQIRRDAEMTLAEKLQTKSALEKVLSFGRKSEKTDALTARMISKYTAAVSAMEKLKVLPETSELQDGYTQYFIKMRQLFVDHSKTGNATETQQSRSVAVKEIQELNKKIRKLDDELRKKYAIPKHKHS